MSKDLSINKMLEDLRKIAGGDTRKIASDARKVAEAQNKGEESAPANPSADPEVDDITLNDGATVESAPNPSGITAAAMGVEAGEGMGGANTSPPKEEPSKGETSPSAKLASDESDPFMDHANSLIAKLKGTGKSASAPAEPKQAEPAVSSDDFKKASRNVAAFLHDKAVGKAAGRDIFGYKAAEEANRKVASAAYLCIQHAAIGIDAASEIADHIDRKVAEYQELGFGEDAIGQAVRKLAEAGMAEAMGQVEQAGEMPPQPDMSGIAPEELAEAITAQLLELIQAGQISPEDAQMIADYLDAQLGGGGGEMPPEAGGEAPPAEGGGEGAEGGEGGGKPPEKSDGGGEKKPSDSGDDKKSDDGGDDEKKEAQLFFDRFKKAGLDDAGIEKAMLAVGFERKSAEPMPPEAAGAPMPPEAAGAPMPPEAAGAPPAAGGANVDEMVNSFMSSLEALVQAGILDQGTAEAVLTAISGGGGGAPPPAGPPPAAPAPPPAA